MPLSMPLFRGVDIHFVEANVTIMSFAFLRTPRPLHVSIAPLPPLLLILEFALQGLLCW